MEKIVKIEGMKCEGCANRVKNSLKELKGIKKIDVNLSDKEAIITYKKELSNDDINRKITALGFSIVEIIDK